MGRLGTWFGKKQKAPKPKPKPTPTPVADDEGWETLYESSLGWNPYQTSQKK